MPSLRESFNFFKELIKYMERGMNNRKQNIT